MTMFSLATQLGAILQQQNKMCTTAESCTAGVLSAAITEVPESSSWFERGFAVYSNEAKMELLGVPLSTLLEEGAVSEATAHAMALGALRRSHAHTSAAITGIAGPEGGTLEKPVGTVCFAWALSENSVITEKMFFKGDRVSVRNQSVLHALSRWIFYLSDKAF